MELWKETAAGPTWSFRVHNSRDLAVGVHLHTQKGDNKSDEHALGDTTGKYQWHCCDNTWLGHLLGLGTKVLSSAF
jgi:hypothetical protein